MGAFFLYHKNNNINESIIDALYGKKGFSTPFLFDIGNYRLRLFKKQLLDIPNYYNSGADYIFVTGSLFYKRLSYRESLVTLLSDFLSDSVDPNALFGNYFILFYRSASQEISISVDPSFIKTVYSDFERKVLTGDFLSLPVAFPGSYTLNTDSIAENITTGHLISPDTYAREIGKIDRMNFYEIEEKFPGIEVRLFTPDIDNYKLTRNEAISDSNNLLSEYFRSANKLCEEFGANIGLTGGFDSRLLLMHARKSLNRLVTMSFKRPSAEYENAGLLAEASGLKFISFGADIYNAPDEDKMIEEAYYFFDGQVRSQNRWDEVFNNPGYCEKIAGGNYVGFHGCGGEQYRNSDRMIFSISLKNYVKQEWMFRQCEDVFRSGALRDNVYKKIREKIVRLTGITGRVGLRELKIIQNEVWNSANRNTRLNLLNQQQFYFAPFTEYGLSQTAYNYVPHLGISSQFQKDMMKAVDPGLASVPNNYGIDILRGLTLMERMRVIIYNLIPRRVFYKLYFIYRNNQSEVFDNQTYKSNSNKVIALFGEEIDFARLGKNKNLGHTLPSLEKMLNLTDISRHSSNN